MKVFRIHLEVEKLDRTAGFYSALLGLQGTRLPGHRHYFDCDGVIVALIDVSAGGQEATALPTDVYFAVPNLEAVHERARSLDALSTGEVHGEPAGEIVVRPWGERSFYAVDAFGNGLCFVDEKTLHR